MRSLAIAPTVVPPDCIEICGERAILRTSRHPKRAHLVLLRNIRQVPEMGARFSLDQDTAKHTSKRHELRTSQRAGPAPGIPGRGFAPTRACLPACQDTGTGSRIVSLDATLADELDERTSGAIPVVGSIKSLSWDFLGFIGLRNQFYEK
jgi:hypothetical protein